MCAIYWKYIGAELIIMTLIRWIVFGNVFSSSWFIFVKETFDKFFFFIIDSFALIKSKIKHIFCANYELNEKSMYRTNKNKLYVCIARQIYWKYIPDDIQFSHFCQHTYHQKESEKKKNFLLAHSNSIICNSNCPPLQRAPANEVTILPRYRCGCCSFFQQEISNGVTRRERVRFSSNARNETASTRMYDLL